MKKLLIYTTVSVLLCGVLLCGSGCSQKINNKSVKSQNIAEYPENNAPAKIINTGDYWYSLINKYGDSSYKLSVSDNPKDIKTVYETEDSSIWFFEANNDYAVWSEVRENENILKLYKNSNDEVTSIYEINTTNEYHNSHIGLYKDYVYYVQTDYKNKIDSIMKYDIKTKKSESIFNASFSEDTAVMNISVRKNYLTATAVIDDEVNLVMFNLDSTKDPVVTKLPENAAYVYDASYDIINDTYAVYYADTKSKEHIGVYNTDSTEIKNILTFNENHYAYEDSIECVNGHLYWIAQANVSGNISDHYQLVDYNYIEDKVKEYRRTFYFNKCDDGFYTLSFDRSGDYQNIILDKYEIKSEGYKA